VGQTATLVNSDTNEEVAQVQVSRVKFSSGDEYNRPERATFMGVYVKVKALADEQNSLWATSTSSCGDTTTTLTAAALKGSSPPSTTLT
jgi:hypothetical protein